MLVAHELKLVSWQLFSSWKIISRFVVPRFAAESFNSFRGKSFRGGLENSFPCILFGGGLTSHGISFRGWLQNFVLWKLVSRQPDESRFVAAR